MLYEMLSGRAPATADDPRVLVLKVERGEVTPLVQAAPGIQPEIAGFVHRAMAPRPELRFANATEMRLALEDLMAGKRPGTAKLAARPAGSDRPAPMAGPSPGAAAGAAFADTADARPEAAGTGTVMGAPVEAALAPPMPGMPSMQPMQPMPPMQHPTPAIARPPAAYEPPPKRGGSGLVIALAVVALLLGAGAVVTYVVSTQPPSPVVPPITLATATTTTPPTATTPAAPTTVTPVTPLTTTPIAPVPPPEPRPQPPNPSKRDAGGQAHPDGGAPPPQDAGSGQTVIVTPFGTFQFPGPRPPFYPPSEPWPPPNITPIPLQNP
jgi:hypothetical protein